jgi:hypothetical protein
MNEWQKKNYLNQQSSQVSGAGKWTKDQIDNNEAERKRVRAKFKHINFFALFEKIRMGGRMDYFWKLFL